MRKKLFISVIGVLGILLVSITAFMYSSHMSMVNEIMPEKEENIIEERELRPVVKQRIVQGGQEWTEEK